MEASDLLKAIMDELKKQPPIMMVFCVIGETSSFVPKSWPKSVLQGAITDTAKNAGNTWILFEESRDKGNAAPGIPQEAARKYNRIYKIQYPVNDKEKIKLETNDPTIKLKPITKHQGKSNEFIQKMVQIAKTISKNRVPIVGTGKEIGTPVLHVVVEGDLDTILHLLKVVEENLPVVIIRGTGKAADLILEYMENLSGSFLKKRASMLFGVIFDDKILSELEETLKRITKYHWLINVFDVNHDDPKMFSKIVGESIITAWAMKETKPDVKSPSSQTQNGAISTDREPGILEAGSGSKLTPIAIKATFTANKGKENEITDHKRLYVLSSRNTSPASVPLYFYITYQVLKNENNIESEKGMELLLEALKANRCDYVDILLDLIMPQLLKDENKKMILEKLYQATVRCASCNPDDDNNCLHIQWILKQAHEEHTNTLFGFKRNIKVESKPVNSEVGDQPIDSKDSKNPGKKARLLCKAILNYPVDSDDDGKSNAQSEEQQKESIFADLLLWSLIANRHEIAAILRPKTNNPLLTSLISVVFLKRLEEKASRIKSSNIAQGLHYHAILFEQRSIALLDKMYELSPEVAMDLIDETDNVWDFKTSPLTFAHENHMYDFIAHTCSQRWLNRQYYNRLAPDPVVFVKSAFACKNFTKFISAPVTRFAINYIMFATMLLSYSAYIMTSIDDENYKRVIARLWEYYTYLWALGDLLETLYLAFGNSKSGGKSHRSMLSRGVNFISNFWNALDFLSYILLITALFVRHFYVSETYRLARRLFSLSLLVMYLRFLQIFLLSKKLGPTLIMIKEMLKDLLIFLLIAVVVVLGVGVYYHTNLFPNHLALFGPGNYDTWSIWKIFYYPYWQLYGETFNDYLEGDVQTDCTTNSSIYNTDPSAERCPEKEWSVPLVSAAYMLISNLLLVNLVIAMFSHTFEKVQENSEKLWRFQRYTVITDYKAKVPSPFIFLAINTWFKRCCYSLTTEKWCCQNGNDDDEDKIKKKQHMKEMQKLLADTC